jgi:hypothetical protein
VSNWVVVEPDHSGSDLGAIAERTTLRMAPDALQAWYRRDVEYLLDEVRRLRSERDERLYRQTRYAELQETATAAQSNLQNERARLAVELHRVESEHAERLAVLVARERELEQRYAALRAADEHKLDEVRSLVSGALRLLDE